MNGFNQKISEEYISLLLLFFLLWVLQMIQLILCHWSLSTPLDFKKAFGFQMFSGSIERGQ